MKKIRTNTIACAAVFVIVLLASSIPLRGITVILDWLAAECPPEIWEFLDKDNPFEGGLSAAIIRIAVGLSITVALFGIAFIVFKVLTAIVNHVLGCDIFNSTDPNGYYVSSGPYTDEDRRHSVQSPWGYFRAYTVVIELTYDEMEQILSYMDLNGELYYELPKSFLMPDNITCLHPIISLRTARRIMRRLCSNGAALLEYKVKYPKKSQIMRIPARMRIRANLHCPTYTSKDVFITTPEE